MCCGTYTGVPDTTLLRSKRKSVGAHEHREAAIAVYQTDRHRCLAMLVSSYKYLH